MKTKTNSSAKWIAGMAASAATASVGQAAVVQFDLVNNLIATLGAGGASGFSTDLTGGGSAVYASGYFFDASVAPDYARLGILYSGSFSTIAYASAIEPGVYNANVGGVDGPPTITGLLEVIITDADINGGLATNAFLEVTAFNTATESGVRLDRIIFDDESTALPTGVVAGGSNTVIGSVENGVFTAVPEPSSLALLALGAGGLALRRQRKKVA